MSHLESVVERASPSTQLILLCLVLAGIALSGSVFPALAGLVIPLLLVVASVGYLFIRSNIDPTPRFEVGTSVASHEYHGLPITVTTEIEYTGGDVESEDMIKHRTVECVVRDEDETHIARETDTDIVGDQPFFGGILGGDREDVRSTTEHVMAVVPEVREQADEWRMAGGNDPELKSALETEFVDVKADE